MLKNHKFAWIHRESKFSSLSIFSRNITEFVTSVLFDNGVDVYYINEKDLDNFSHAAYVGSLFNIDEMISSETFLKPKNILCAYDVDCLHEINRLTNLQIHFIKNTEDDIPIKKEFEDFFDCCICLSSGLNIFTIPNILKMPLGSKVIIADISKHSLKINKDILNKWNDSNDIDLLIQSLIQNDNNILFEKNINLNTDNFKKRIDLKYEFVELNFFNLDAVKRLVDNLDSKKIFWNLSNCFNYIPTALIFDINTRYKIQQDFFNILNDSGKDFYVECTLADGHYQPITHVRNLLNYKIDNRFKILPWYNELSK